MQLPGVRIGAEASDSKEGAKRRISSFDLLMKDPRLDEILNHSPYENIRDREVIVIVHVFEKTMKCSGFAARAHA